MKPSNTVWGRILACCLTVNGTLGLWAGGAAAQTSDGWFDDSAQAPAQPADEGGGPSAPSQPDYSPPPADFQTPPPAAAPAPSDTADAPEDDASAQTRAVQEFSPRLEPYGRWVDDPWYGRVWVPSRSVVGNEFVPYSTGGHWELTPEDTWLWASDYPFGWITFHYGRWVWSAGGAWGWVPGYVYSPAWVDFRVGATGYIGWAPLGPTYVWRNGVFLSVGVYRPAPFVYCPTQYVFVRTMPRYVVRDNYRVRAISAQSYPVRPRYLSRGGVSYVSRGPSPREAHIPVSALPSRRVIAQPRLAPFSGTRQTRLESSTYSGNRGSPANRNYLPNRSYPAERAPAVRPQSYDRYRAPAVPQRTNPAVRPPAPSPSNGWYGRGSEGWYGRGGDRFSPNAGQRMQPNRSAPAPVPRGGYRPLPYNGPDRGAGAPGAAAPRGVAPAARPAPARRGQRKDGNNSSGDSHVRGRAPQR